MQKFDEVYDPKRIEDAKHFLRSFWNGSQKIAYSCYPSGPSYEKLPDDDKMVELASQNILSGAELPGFNVPRFIANLGPESLPAYWGGHRHTYEEGKFGIEPVIFTASDVDAAAPKDYEAGDAARAVRIFRKLSEKLGTKNLACSGIDIQGPLSVASLLWQQEDFMMSMYDAPAQVHKLLEQVTEHIIRVLHDMIGEAGNFSGPLWPYIWLPPDIGVGIVEDYMPLLPPDLYKEFGLPYVERISDEFGGVFFHCCGRFSQHLHNLSHSKVNYLGLEFQYPFMKPEELYDHFGSSIAFAPILSFKGRDEFPQTIDFLRHLCGARFKDMRRFFILNLGGDRDVLEQAAYLDAQI